MSIGAWVLVSAVVLAAVLGAWHVRSAGRFRGARPPAAVDPAAEAADQRPEGEPSAPALEALAAVGAGLGERATLLQFSSAFCAPCRTTRVVLDSVARDLDGVSHVEVDAEEHLALVRSLGVLRTPTTIVLDAAGREVTRASGAPRREQVLAALPDA